MKGNYQNIELTKNQLSDLNAGNAFVEIQIKCSSSETKNHKIMLSVKKD